MYLYLKQVSAKARLRAGRSGIRIPAEAKDFCLFRNVSTPAVGPTQPSTQWVPTFCPGNKVAGA